MNVHGRRSTPALILEGPPRRRLPEFRSTFVAPASSAPSSAGLLLLVAVVLSVAPLTLGRGRGRFGLRRRRWRWLGQVELRRFRWCRRLSGSGLDSVAR